MRQRALEDHERVSGVLAIFTVRSLMCRRLVLNAPAVPTWNYAVVRMAGRRSGTIAIFSRSFCATWLTSMKEPDPPWRIEDQPSDFHESMLARIVGFEMPVLKIEAQFKLGQNRRLEDRAGTIEGLERGVSPTAWHWRHSCARGLAVNPRGRLQ
jgi:transcriptional regulator